MMDFFVIVMVTLDKLKGEADRQEIQIVFDLHQNVSFRTDGFTQSKVMMVLMESKLVEKTLTVNVDS